MVKYMISIWENKIKNDIEKAKAEGKELKTEEIELPIILPVVVYHGKYEWNIRRTLGEMMPGYIDLPKNIKKYIPNYEYLLTDITKPDDKVNLKEEHAIVLETLSKVKYVSKEGHGDRYLDPPLNTKPEESANRGRFFFFVHFFLAAWLSARPLPTISPHRSP
ncbi:MAG: Rpn family recombination-promoting nuclease/putative transposase [Natronincolaceae bacterium]